MGFKRIVIITDAWEPQVSGVVTTLKKMVEFATKDGYDTCVIHPDLFKTQFRFKAYPEIPFVVPTGLSKMLKHQEGTVYHIATEGPLGLAAGFILTSRNKRYTTSYHTDWPKLLKDVVNVPKWMSREYLRWFHRKRKVYCATKAVAEHLTENDIGRRHIIWSRGVDPTIFTPRVTKSKEQPILLSVGRVSKEKNLDVFCQLPDKYVKIVVGDGPYRKELEQKYPNVKFAGYKFGKELAEFYQTADCLVFSSKADTFGVVMIESMFCGTPVAAYPVQGPIDIIDNKYTGYTNENLEVAIEKCLLLSRKKCSTIANDSWSWEESYKTFVNNLERDK